MISFIKNSANGAKHTHALSRKGRWVRSQNWKKGKMNKRRLLSQVSVIFVHASDEFEIIFNSRQTQTDRQTDRQAGEASKQRLKHFNLRSRPIAARYKSLDLVADRYSHLIALNSVL